MLSIFSPNRMCLGFMVLLVVAAAVAWPTSAAAEDGKARVVLVPPFENFSNKKSWTYYEIPVPGGSPGQTQSVRVDSYSHSPRTSLEEILSDYIGKDFRIIERQRLDQMLVEGEFANKSMLVDEDTAFRLGQVLGANTVVLGSIRSINEERKTFRGYGISTENVEVTGKINIRVIDLESMEILKSRTFEDTVQFSASNYGGHDASDTSQAVIEAVMKQVAEDEEFLESVAGLEDSAESALVEVNISSRPEGADVLINGEYVGNTPLALPLAAGEPVTLTLNLPGHRSWENTLRPRAGMSLSPTLAAE